MLIHKATMGVLDRVWLGQYTRGPDGIQIPLEHPAVRSDVEDPEAWWEISGKGPLAAKIRRYYPFLRPVTGPDGELADVTLLETEGLERTRQEAAAARTQEARQRGYQRTGRVRPKGLMPFLSCT